MEITDESGIIIDREHNTYGKCINISKISIKVKRVCNTSNDSEIGLVRFTCDSKQL